MLALAATCSLPAAAQASDLPSVQHAAAGVTAQLGQTATAAGAVALDTTAPAQAAVQQTAAEVVAPARPAVEHAAETVTKTAAAQRPAVGTVVETVETAPTQPVAPAPAAKRAGDGVRALRSAPSEGTVQKPRRHRNAPAETARPSEREGLPSGERAARVSQSTPSAPSATAGSESADGGASATFELVAGAGSTASASSTAFSIGAVGLLAAALMLAAPAAARRLRADGASLRPVLFASVLERPG